MNEANLNQTDSITRIGLCKNSRMPFTFKFARSTFQQPMDLILATVKLQQALVYIDNIVVLSNTLEEHLRHLSYVRQVLEDTGLILKLKKCFFVVDINDYLRHDIATRKLMVKQKL